MNYYEPCQVAPNSDRPDAGKWRYTCMNDGEIWPVGYCAQDCPGHDDKTAAYEHQTQYLLDQRLNLDLRYVDEKHQCQATLARGDRCQEWTDAFAEINNGITFNLCDVHRTREVFAALFGSVGDVISSW